MNKKSFDVSAIRSLIVSQLRTSQAVFLKEKDSHPLIEPIPSHGKNMYSRFCDFYQLFYCYRTIVFYKNPV